MLFRVTVRWVTVKSKQALVNYDVVIYTSRLLKRLTDTASILTQTKRISVPKYGQRVPFVLNAGGELSEKHIVSI